MKTGWSWYRVKQESLFTGTVALICQTIPSPVLELKEQEPLHLEREEPGELLEERELLQKTGWL